MARFAEEKALVGAIVAAAKGGTGGGAGEEMAGGHRGDHRQHVAYGYGGRMTPEWPSGDSSQALGVAASGRGPWHTTSGT